MMQWMKVNPVGLLFAAIAYILIGIIFYSKWALGRFWLNLTHHMQKQAEWLPLKIYMSAFISAIVIAYVMGCFLNLANTKTISSGAFIGFLIWAGFILPTIFSPVLFGKKPVEMFWLDCVYYLIAYMSLGIISVKFNS